MRRRETIGGFNRPLEIFFEEINKCVNGAVDTIGSNDSGPSGQSIATSLWETMWRDGLKYAIYLHPISQTPSALPPGIRSSCANAFFGQLKHIDDRDVAMAHIARSERGYVDEEYKRYLSRAPAARKVVKLGYGQDEAELEPMLVRPLHVPALEPTDAEILERLGAA